VVQQCACREWLRLFAFLGEAEPEESVAGLARAALGRAVRVAPIKPKLKPPGTTRLKVKCGILVSTSAFTFNLRHYISGGNESPVSPSRGGSQRRGGSGLFARSESVHGIAGERRTSAGAYTRPLFSSS
jgi:hypothetical protein